MWLPSFQLCCQQRGSPPGLQHEWQRKCARLTCGSVGVGDSVWTKEAGQTWCEWWNIFVDSLFFQLPACFADNLPIWAKTAKQIKLALDSSKRLRICWGLGMNLILGIMGFDRNSSHQTCRKQTSKFQWIAPQVHKKGWQLTLGGNRLSMDTSKHRGMLSQNTEHSERCMLRRRQLSRASRGQEQAVGHWRI